MKKIKDVETDMKDESERNLFYNLRAEINGAIEEYMGALSGKIEKLTSDVADISSKTQTLSSNIESLTTATENLGNTCQALNEKNDNLSTTVEGLTTQMQDLLENVIPNLQGGSGGESWETLFDKDDENLNYGYPDGLTPLQSQSLEKSFPDLAPYKRLRATYSIHSNLFYALYDITDIQVDPDFDFRCINYLTCEDLGKTIYCITGLFHFIDGVKRFQFNRVASIKFVNKAYPTWTLENNLSSNLLLRLEASQ